MGIHSLVRKQNDKKKNQYCIIMAVLKELKGI